jgi:iron complex outermembrane receptor protein
MIWFMDYQVILLGPGKPAIRPVTDTGKQMKNLQSVLLVFAYVFSPVTFAQTESGKSAVLEEVIVTAQRRAESLQDAAIAINAATGERLELLGVKNAEGLNKIAPALTVLSGGGANTAYFIRGVGNFTNNGYTNPAVTFNLDGVYIGRPSSTIASFLDLDRVEVLKGPQGTLYGRNSTGGAINVIPNAPVIGESSSSAELGVGNYGAFDVTGVGNYALSDNSAIRLAAIISEHDAYFDDGTSDAEDVALRAQYYLVPSDDLSIRISADYSTQEGTGPGIQVMGHYAFQPFSPNLPVPNWRFVPVPDSLSGDFTGMHNPGVLDYIRNTIAGAPGHMPFEGFAYPVRDDSYWGVNAEIKYNFEWAELTVIPAYRVSELDNVFNGPPFKSAINEDKAKQSSLEARLAGEAGKLDYILGAYYFDENVKGVNSFNQFTTVSHNDWDSNVESAALFARGTFNVSDSFRLVGGIRYTDENRSMVAETYATAAVCLERPVGRPPFCPQIPTLPTGLTLYDTISQIDPALFPTGSPINPDGSITPGARPFGPINYFAPAQFGPGAILAITPTPINEKDGDSEFTYRAAVEYDLTLENLLYVSYETGFRAGGFNLATGRESYDPEYIDAYTLGSKNRFLDNSLEVNVEVFYWLYDGQQLAALGLDTLGNNSFYTRNVGSSTNKGVEVDFQWAVAKNTLLRGGVQYLDATYDEYAYTQVDLSTAGIDPPNFLTPINTCTNTLGIFDGDTLLPYDPALDVVGAKRGFLVDCSGKDAMNSPEWSMTFGIQQSVDLDGMTVIGSMDARYRGDRELGFNYVPGGRVDSDITADVALTLISHKSNLTFTAYIHNLTDEAIASTYQLGSGNVVGSAYEPPRTYGLRLGYDF